VIMNGLAHHVVSDTGMIGAGAQESVVYFRAGNAISAPAAPIMRVSSNSIVYFRMRDNMDIMPGPYRMVRDQFRVLVSKHSK